MSTPGLRDGRPEVASKGEPSELARRRIVGVTMVAALALATLLAGLALAGIGAGSRMVAAGSLAVAGVAALQLRRHRHQPALLLAFVVALVLVVYRGSFSDLVLGNTMLALAVLAALATVFVPAHWLRPYLVLLAGLWVSQLVPHPARLGEYLPSAQFFTMSLQLAMFLATAYGLRLLSSYVSSADRRYGLLYERVPVSVWDEDFTAVGAYLDGLREAGVVDLRTHLEAHPELIDEAAALIRVRNVNPAAISMLDMDDKSSLLGAIDPRTVTDETRSSYLEQLVAIWDGSDSVRTEVVGQTATGRPFDGVLRWSAPGGPDGLDLANVVVTIDDVTALKAVQRDLADTNALLRAIAAAQRNFITGVDADQVLGELLEEVVAMTGCRFGLIADLAEEGPGVGRIHGAVAPGWDPEGRCFVLDGSQVGVTDFDQVVAAAVRSATPAAARNQSAGVWAVLPSRAGSVHGLPLAFGGRTRGVLLLGDRPGGFGASITEALQPVVSTCAAFLAAYHGETLRREAERRLRFVLDNVSDMVWTMDAEGRIGYMSSSVERILGFTADEVAGTSALALVHPDDVPAILDAAQVAPGEITVPVMHRVRRRDGDWLWMEATAANHLDGRGFSAWVVNSRDITRRKRYEDGLRDAKEAAEEAARVKSEFLANMSHEIRTPMNAILGMTELSLGTQLSAQQREYLGSIKSSIDVLLTLINDILDLSRIEADRVELGSIPFSLRDVLGETVATLSGRAAAKALELRYEYPAEVPEALVGDPGRLRQVLFNLIGNAVKFTHVGHVAVDVEVQERRDAGATLHFRVSDTGIGIPEGGREQIFRAFEQADGSMTRRYGGSGLGLAISRQLVELMGGEIWVDSEPGRGTVFHFTASFGFQDAAQRLGLDVRAGPEANAVLLLVTDAGRRRSLAEVLRQGGITPVAADDWESVVDLHQQALDHGVRPAAIVICGVDGDSELVERAAGSAALAGLPVVAVAGAGSDTDGAALQRAGAVAFLSHPLDAGDLVEAVQLAASGVSGPLITREWLRERRRPLRVLVVDDSPTNRLVATRLLEERGHRTAVAEDGHAAVAAVRSGDFDLVLMDIQMPVLDGLEATEIIRSAEAGTGRHLPIVALTAHAMDGDRERCLAAGMDAYLAKPFRAEEIYAVVEQIGEAHRSPKG